MKSNPFSLVDKNILITGASSGIGRQCAISCSEMGARVVLIGRREDKLIETKNLLFGTGHLYFVLDITNYSEIENVISNTVSIIGAIHGYIHSAGIEFMLPLAVSKPNKISELLAINVVAAFEFTRILSKNKYYAQSGASFVLIASIMGVVGEMAHSAYCSSKGALISGSRAIALELASKNIRVNCISPGQVLGTQITDKMLENFSDNLERLNMHPLGYGNTIDVANGCIYLLSDASKWVTGTNLIIDGGYSAK